MDKIEGYYSNLVTSFHSTSFDSKYTKVLLLKNPVLIPLRVNRKKF